MPYAYDHLISHTMAVLFQLQRTKAIAWTPQAPITDAPKSNVS